MDGGGMTTLYCVCQKMDSNGLMIECIRGSGGCSGWVHPICCGLLHSVDELEAIPDFICPLCEQSEDDYKKLKATNAKMANHRLKKRKKKALKMIKKEGQKQKQDGATTTLKDNDAEVVKKDDVVKTKKEVKMESSASSSLKKEANEMWKCTACTMENPMTVVECDECYTNRKTGKKRKSRRSSGREGKAKKKNYHVPASDEGTESDDELLTSKAKRKKKKKKEDDDDDTDDDDVLAVKEEPVVDTVTLIVDKICGVRQEKTGVTRDLTTATSLPSREFYIKWKGFSYMHASWELEETLTRIDVNNKGKIKRFEEKRAIKLMYSQDDEEEFFNPVFLEIHRLLAERYEEPLPHEEGDLQDDGSRFFVKWRALPYADSTWERGCDLGDDKAIALFRELQKVPPQSAWNPLPHPHIKEYKKLEESPLFGADQTLKLREYQLEGVNWLMWNYYNKRASILADEMGLGKTIQTLAFLDQLRKSENIMCRGPFLIVAPLSLVAQWQNETDLWTTMDCIVYHGNSDSREIMQNFEFYYNGDDQKPDKKKPLKFNILVTTYEIAIKDIRLLGKIQWRCMIVDEAHRLKNHQSRLVEQLRDIKRDYCVLLTGTPLQNKTEELWSLLNFVDQNHFPSLDEFMLKFGNLQNSSQVAELHKMLKPFLLRRVKEDVEKSLPPKEETIIEVELTPVQKQWYRAIYEKNTSFLYKGNKPSNSPNLMNVMMELRKCCNHPYLNRGVEAQIAEHCTTDVERHDMMVKCCGKLVLMDKLLPRLKADGHKILVFSQMVRVLDILEDYIRYMGYVYERLDGNIRGNDRQGAIDRFVKPEMGRFIMLLSTKAGGLGLNLTAADTVIIFDSDWNPQNDLQAQARAHRIGQTQSVKIYRLITRKTYEMHMFHKASLKLGLDQAVLTHMRLEKEGVDSTATNKQGKKTQEALQIEELLKKGAYDVFREDDDAAEQFCAADIDSILKRSSKIRQYEQTARSQFSKASFVSSTTADDVDIDDPDFWKKAIGLEEPVELSELDKLLMSSDRKRTRVSRFGALEEEDDNSSDGHDGVEGESDKEGGEGADKRKSRDWTINGRDRVQRALMHYGFGRWETIRKQSGGSRDIPQVEAFGRSFVLQCGLCCADDANEKKEDSPFVKGAIRAAMAVQVEYVKDNILLPPVLTDIDFVTKLKQGGARRALIRLDMLLRLQRMILGGVEELDKQAMVEEHDENGNEGNEKPTDIDARIRLHGIRRVADAMTILDVGDRPAWSILTPWWDTQADRHVLMGVFMHGYGRATHILSDPTLCFAERIQKTIYEEKKEDVSEIGQEHDGSTMEVDSAPAATASVSAEASSSVPEAAPSAPEAAASVPVPSPSCVLPEVQQINRLLFWLLSAEDLQRQHLEEEARKNRILAEKDRQTELEKAQREASIKRAERKAIQLVHTDILRHEAFIQNKRAALMGVPQKKSKEWTKEEKKSLCYVLATYGFPRDGALGDAVEEENDTLKKNEFTWCDLIFHANLAKTPIRVRTYVLEKYLTKCTRVSTITIDPLANNHGYSDLDNSSEFVDVSTKTLAHGLKAKHVALLCLRRRTLLKGIQYVVWNRQEELLLFLRSEECRRTLVGMPVWWCPWIHDVGMLEGITQYGVLSWKAIRQDETLPFHPFALQEHIRSVFLTGAKGHTPPVASEIFSTHANLCMWFKTVCDAFPPSALLESRLVQIVSTLTSHLPQDHEACMLSLENIPCHHSSAMIDFADVVGPEYYATPPSRVEDIMNLQSYIHETKEERNNVILDTNTLSTLHIIDKDQEKDQEVITTASSPSTLN